MSIGRCFLNLKWSSSRGLVILVVESLVSHACCMLQRFVRETDQTIILDDIKDLKVLGPVFKELANGGITKDGAKEFRMSRPIIVLCNPPEFERLQETSE